MSCVNVVVVSALAICSLVFAEEETAALSYDTATFQDAITIKDHFVKFYAPWCGHCKRLAPVWDELSEKYNTGEDSIVTIAKVDCTIETKLCSDHGVTGFPTLKLYRPGQDAVRYKGKRDLTSLENFVQENLDPKEPEVPQPPEAKHGLYELTDANFKSHIEKGNHFIKFYAPWCGHCKRLAPTWDQLAQGFQHSETVTIAKVDCTAHRSVCEQYGVKGYPTLKFFHDGEEVDAYHGGRDHVALKEYVTKMIKGGATADAAAPAPVQEEEKEEAATEPPQEEEPEPTDSKVVVLTSQTFREKAGSGLAFVKFYAPWCPHCKKLVPTWDQLAEKFDDSPGVVIAKVDCTVEKEICQKNDVRGYPSLLLFKDGQRIDKHSGARTLEALQTYLNSKLPKEEL